MRRPRVSEMLDLPFEARRQGETKQAWVYRRVRQLILDGHLRRGERLPSSRALAASWGLSRGIVEIAFEQLVLEGYVASRVGRGTEVIADLTAPVLNAPTHSPAPDVRRALQADTMHDAVAEQTDAIETAPSPSPTSSRLVDTALFTMSVWHRHVNRAIKDATPALLAENDPRGYAPLRAAISRYLRMTRGIRCDISQIMVTTGIRHAIDLIAKAFSRDDPSFYIEDPGYKMLAPLLRYATDKLVFVPLDEEGFCVDTIDPHCQPGFAFVTPAHQAPLGITMSVNRRSQLLAWAHERDMWIVEDDYDSEFSYGSAPLPALKAIDRQERVIHCGSFNKSLFPSLRIGYMVLPEILSDRLAAVRAVTGRSNSLIEQMALTHYIEAGDFARHLRASRNVYMRRRDQLISALRDTLPAKWPLSGEHAGFHFVIGLPKQMDEHAMVAEVLRNGVFVEGLSEFSHRHRTPPALVLGYANLDGDGIVKAARVIGDAWRLLHG